MEGSRILVIEKNQELSSKLSDILTLGKYAVEVIADGKQAIERIRKHPIDLIISGVNLSGVDGFGVLRTINKFMETSGIGFIMLFQEFESTLIRKAMELGADGFIVYPFDDVELLNQVEVRLRKRRFQQERFLKERLQLKRMDHISDAMAWLNLRLERFPVKNYKKHQPLYHQGERTSGIHFIREGRIKTYITDERGNMIISAIYGPGEYFGLENIALQVLTQESAEAIEQAKIITIPIPEIQEIVIEYPDLLRIFIKDLSRTAHKLNERLVDLAHCSVRKRVANAIMRLSEETHAGQKVVSLSRNDLANFTGMATETLSRVLSELNKDGLIDKQGHDIVVQKTEKLKTIKN